MTAAAPVTACTAEPQDDDRTGWPVLGVAGLGALLCFFNVSAVNVVLPAISRGVDATAAQAGWILLSYMLVTTVCILSFGRLADIWGRRELFLAGLAVFVVASAGCALSGNAATLLAWRMVQAIGAAGVMANTSALVGDAFGRRKMGLALGLIAMIAAISQVAGPSAGGLIVSQWGWQALFLVNVPIGLCALAWSWRVLPRRGAGGPRQRFDVAGAVLSSVGLGALIHALSRAGTHGWHDAAVHAGLVVGAAVLAGFVRTQLSSASPLLNIELLRDPQRRVAYACMLLVSMAQAAPLVLVACFLQATSGLGYSDVGLRVVPVALGMLIAAPLAGALMHRFTATQICNVGMALAASGLALLAALIRPGMGAMESGLCLWLLGLGIGSFVTPNNAAILQSVTPDRRGVANGLRATLQNTGIMIGTAVAVSVATSGLSPAAQRAVFRGVGGVLTPADVGALSAGVTAALAILAGCCAAGVLMGWRQPLRRARG